MSDDDDRTPMTRTELAMLWDLAGRWIATHPAGTLTATSWERQGAADLRVATDAELTERFGG